VIEFYDKHPLEGYRRLTFMMLDADVVAASPATVYRVLSRAGLLSRTNVTPSKKGTGFQQPLQPHEHWHVDISYLNIAGTFFYLCTVLDGASRAVVHWDVREQMKEADVELVIEAAREKFPGTRPRIISDNGPQFLAREFKEYVRLTGMTHVRTSPYYPQSNGKLERFHKTIKGDAIRPAAPQTVEQARRVIAAYVEHYNGVRLHSAIGYVTPNDVLANRQRAIWDARDHKLARARELRAQRRAALKADRVAA
jgi:putative transposase